MKELAKLKNFIKKKLVFIVNTNDFPGSNDVYKP